MHLDDPFFPPLLKGHAVKSPQRVLDTACGGAEAGTLEAGAVVWARHTSVAELAFVFEPEVVRGEAEDMRIVLQTAIADGLGAIMPSQTAIQFRWPDDIVVNGAKVGETILVASARETDGVPAWLVVAARLVLTRQLDDLEPGLVRDESSIAEEDGADLDRTRIITTLSAHMLNAVQDWAEEGTRPFAERWIGRIVGFEDGAAFNTPEGGSVHARPVGASGGGALMVRDDNATVTTVTAPSRTFGAADGGLAPIAGAPWR